MHLHMLRSYCRVIELGGFSAAARSLHVTQPVISSHVKSLEEHFGVRLIDRGSTPVVPTTEGQRFYELACDMLNRWELAQQELRPRGRRVSGSVVAGSSYTVAMYVLPQILGKIRDQHPDLHVRMLVFDSAPMVESVLAQQVDFGILDRRVAHQRLRYTPLFRDEQVLIAAPSHPAARRGCLTAQELSRYRYFLWETGTGTRQVIDAALEEADVGPLPITMELNGEGIKHGVEAGLGLGFVSRLAVQHELRNGSLVIVPVEGVSIVREHYLVQRDEALHSRAVEAVLEFLLQQVPELVCKASAKG